MKMVWPGANPLESATCMVTFELTAGIVNWAVTDVNELIPSLPSSPASPLLPAGPGTWTVSVSEQSFAQHSFPYTGKIAGMSVVTANGACLQLRTQSMKCFTLNSATV